MHLLPPPGYWYTSFFFLAGPGTLGISQFQRFREIHWVVQIRCHSYLAPYVPKCFSAFPLFYLRYPFPPLGPSSYLSPVPSILSHGQQLFLSSSYILLYSLGYAMCHLIPVRSLLLSPTQLYQLRLATSFFTCSLLYIIAVGGWFWTTGANNHGWKTLGCGNAKQVERTNSASERSAWVGRLREVTVQDSGAAIMPKGVLHLPTTLSSSRR